MKKVAAIVMFAFALPAGAAVETVTPFGLDATGFGGPVLTNIGGADFSYQAEVDMLGDHFSISGVAFYGSLRHNLGDPPIPNSGLGNKYGLYTEFQGSGALSEIAPGVVQGNFTKFDMNFKVDTKLDTVGSGFTPGLGGGNESRKALNTSDDITLFSGDLVKGQSHTILDLDKGAFNVLVHSADISPLLSGLDKYQQFRLTGVNSFINGGLVVPPGVAVDLDMSGSGNLSAVIPEPGIPVALAFGGLALFGIKRLRRE